MITQRWDKEVDGDLQRAIVYYSILSNVNELDLTVRQVELLAFTSLRGTISSITAKREFARRFSSSVDSVGNLISNLYRRQFLQKEGKRIFVNPAIDFDFSEDIVINIRISGPKRKDN